MFRTSQLFPDLLQKFRLHLLLCFALFFNPTDIGIPAEPSELPFGKMPGVPLNQFHCPFQGNLAVDILYHLPLPQAGHGEGVTRNALRQRLPCLLL